MGEEGGADCVDSFLERAHTPVVACGVDRYCIRKAAKACSRATPRLHAACKDCLTVRTSLSAAPFEAGWYGEVLMCFTPLVRRNDSNSEDVNCGPLSETNCLGIP